jgi:biopolymer transport protein ExbD
MTILLIFLIKSFSVEGNIMTPSPDLQLPVSRSKDHPGVIPTIEITQSSIIAEGKTITTIQSFLESKDMKIPQLFTYLHDKKNRDDNTDSENELMIQSDKEIEFNILKRVMYTCGKAGYSDFTILVIQEG